MSRAAAARALLAARDQHLTAEAAAYAAKEKYIAAEDAYFEACKAEMPSGNEAPWLDYPNNVLIGNTLIMPVSEWYEARKGSRLEFHTVEVLP